MCVREMLDEMSGKKKSGAGDDSKTMEKAPDGTPYSEW
jgi:hypothetical protein